MANTCIICGGPAGSGEHVFPASLGGRRTNKNIYCTTDDNGYSSLVADLANQLDLFNSLLGVRPDHGNVVKSVLGRDKHSGEMVELCVDGTKFAEPRVLSQERTEKGTIVHMGFSDHKALKTWREAQEAAGAEVKILAKGTKRTYLVGTVQFTRQFGGVYGLGAIAYVGQTFLAQAFPDVARSSALDEFKRYTQCKAVEARKKDDTPSSWQIDPPVWWDFDPQPDPTPNVFPFGHRVTVGIDSTDGLIFGRISFFSTLHFSMIFGRTTDVAATRTVTVDIDPLADHPPNDISKNEQFAALARVNRPACQTDALASNITSGSAKRMFDDLLRRMMDFDLKRTAEAMHGELRDAGNLTAEERRILFETALENRSQRIWNLTFNVVSRFKATLTGNIGDLLSPKLDALVAFDATSANGLSVKATHSFELAQKALLKQMLEDYDAGRLDVQRLADLIGDGPGLAVIGGAVLPQALP